MVVHQLNLGLLLLRLVFGLFVAYHGYNKVFSAGGLAGTARWFEGMGLRWPRLQARMAATFEMGAGVAFAAGLLTPFAASALIGVMLVAIWIDHRKVGFWVFLPGEGWEYCASIAVAVFVTATIGPGEWSLDHAFGITWHGWWGAVIAGGLALVGTVVQLAVCYRPQEST